MSGPLVIGRLAPSPTGALHVGNARSFLLAWLSVRQQRGQLILRIEDIDSPRVKPWAVQATLDDLRWLGLDWDVGPDRAIPGHPACIQTQRLPRYASVLEQLIAAGRVYRCVCTRSEVAQAASAPHEQGLQPLEGTIYPGTCRPPRHTPQPQLPPGRPADEKFAWRWQFAPDEVRWCDQFLGNMAAYPALQLGDFVIARGDGTPAYQLAVVVDDHDMQVSEVVRGDDLLPSTYRQLAIIDFLGWPRPNYYHVPLMVGTDGRRLAKRHGDTRLSAYREAGMAPEQIVGYLAWTLGLQPRLAPLAAAELIGRLDWTKLPRSPTVFHEDQLRSTCP